MEIENVEINVPTHFPNNIPDIKSIGVPKPKSITQNDENKKNRNRFSTKFFIKPIILLVLMTLEYQKIRLFMFYTVLLEIGLVVDILVGENYLLDVLWLQKIDLDV